MIGTIKLGKNTGGHLATLAALGYKAEIVGDSVHVECTGFVDVVDGADGLEAALADVVKAGQLLTYTTRVAFEDGRILFGVPACCKLGVLSALVVKPAKETKVKVDALSSLMAKLGR